MMGLGVNPVYVAPESILLGTKRYSQNIVSSHVLPMIVTVI